MLLEEELGDWLDVVKCVLERGRLLMVFQEIYQRVVQALEVIRPAGPNLTVVRVEKKRKDTTRELVPDRFTGVVCTFQQSSEVLFGNESPEFLKRLIQDGLGSEQVIELPMRSSLYCCFLRLHPLQRCM